VRPMDKVYHNNDVASSIFHSGIAWRFLFCNVTVNIALERLQIWAWIGSEDNWDWPDRGGGFVVLSQQYTAK